MIADVGGNMQLSSMIVMQDGIGQNQSSGDEFICQRGGQGGGDQLLPQLEKIGRKLPVGSVCGNLKTAYRAVEDLFLRIRRSFSDRV